MLLSSRTESCLKRTLIPGLIWDVESLENPQLRKHRGKRSGRISILMGKHFAIMLSGTRLQDIVSNAGLTCNRQ